VKRPSRPTLYALIVLFVVLAVVSVIVGTPVAILLWLVMLAIVVYFALVALDDAGKLRRR
jgi:UDP-N-acetylmuramyl pentapeptide phosphotransferase/UDP-N-acetylglucosamine-1-phosphate transferase